ncbi:TetR/AcrR family transcriptional regulator [Mycetocola reblochoni]|uniref:Transcriptional regulator, TetR family n=1 Tax=Mycetocola reblochoni REB411 TaxID=1255698 RepID=A0A1R4IVD0_9MICO|nr:TetR/AcrR family transcriptional regulator [Mycetocola reblochoni]SJN23535.1 Transcriptional regulator, TetR family [Mycetocola reblochoni REB411]
MDTTRQSTRRRHLVDATERVLRRQGVTRANVRAVAAEAEVSPGAVLYYFPTFDELMLTAVESVLDRFHTEREALLDGTTGHWERIEMLIEAGIPDDAGPEIRVLYESVAFLQEKPQYKPIHRSVVERQVSLYRGTIAAGVEDGAFSPAQPVDAIARNIVALEDAYDLYPLIGVEHAASMYRANAVGYAALALGVDPA